MAIDKTLAKVVVQINQTANKYQSSIVIKTDNAMIDAKSILGLTNSILTSSSFHLEIHGSDEDQAKTAMQQVFRKNGLPVSVR